MSFPYPAGTWVPHTAAQHAADILANINAALAAAGVLDSNGNPMVLQPIATNAVWILCLAIGAMRANDDQALLAAAQMFSIAECSNQQIQELLPIAGTALLPGAYSLVTLQVIADGSGATVTAGSKAPFGSICNFVTLATVVIPASGTVNILAQADVIGPIDAGPGQIVSFNPTIAHVTVVTNPAASIQGRNPETVPQVRQRLLTGDTADLGIDGTIRALRSIQGVAQATMYFNFDPVNPLVLAGGTSIPPRTAYLLIVGQDASGDSISAAYAKRMSSPTLPVGTTTYTRTDISFAASDNSVNTAAGNFVTAGFAVGQFVKVTGSGSNNVTGGLITTLSATKMILSQVTLVNESGGPSDTITLLPAEAYTTAGGQILPIYYRVAPSQRLYVQVLYDGASITASGFQANIQSFVSAIQLGIGQKLTSAMVSQALQGFSYALITGCQVSTDGVTWKNEVAVNGDSYGTIAGADVTVAVQP